MPWFKDNGVKSVWVQHFSREEAVRTTYELAEEIGLKHPPGTTPNHAACTLDGGDEFKIIARLTPSFILSRSNRRADKYHGGTTEYKRVVFQTGESGMADNGLFAVGGNTIYFQDYGTASYEKTKYEITALPSIRSRRSPDKAMSRLPPELGLSQYQLTRGISAPFPLRDHPHLGSNELKVA